MRRKNRRIYGGRIAISKKILGSIFLVFIAGIFVFFLFIRKNSENPGNIIPDESTVAFGEKQDVPLPVKVSLAKRGDLIIKFTTPGEAVTNKKIVIKPEVAGIVKCLNIAESQYVKKGDLLVEMDDREFRLELERAQASRLRVLSELLVEKRFGQKKGSSVIVDRPKIQKAKEDYKRAKQLYLKGFLSKQGVEKAHSQYEFALIESGQKKDEILAASKGLTQAEVDVKRAQINLEKTKIRAPFSGIITDIKISSQESLARGRDLFTLVNISQIRVQARVIESEIGKMKVGREVDLKFSAYPDKYFKGRVKAISPVINTEDKTCKVLIDMTNPEEKIKPGMHAEVEIAAEIYEDRLLVPQQAILIRAGKKLVFVVEDGIAKWRYIEVGLENEDYAEVLEGIEEGEQVILEGHFTLAHDARVRLVQ